MKNIFEVIKDRVTKREKIDREPYDISKHFFHGKEFHVIDTAKEGGGKVLLFKYPVPPNEPFVQYSDKSHEWTAAFYNKYPYTFDEMISEMEKRSPEFAEFLRTLPCESIKDFYETHKSDGTYYRDGLNEFEYHKFSGEHLKLYEADASLSERPLEHILTANKEWPYTKSWAQMVKYKLDDEKDMIERKDKIYYSKGLSDEFYTRREYNKGFDRLIKEIFPEIQKETPEYFIMLSSSDPNKTCMIPDLRWGHDIVTTIEDFEKNENLTYEDGETIKKTNVTLYYLRDYSQKDIRLLTVKIDNEEEIEPLYTAMKELENNLRKAIHDKEETFYMPENKEELLNNAEKNAEQEYIGKDIYKTPRENYMDYADLYLKTKELDKIIGDGKEENKFLTYDELEEMLDNIKENAGSGQQAQTQYINEDEPNLEPGD